MRMETRSIIAFIILAIISVTDCAYKMTCPVKYTRFSTRHSFCTQRNPKCNVLRQSLDKDDRSVILKVHNELRSKVANGKERNLPTASNMLQMEWDAELAVIAQKWANQCNFDHDCDGCRTVENFDVGQNMALQTSSCSSEDCLKGDWVSVIKGFYNEVKDFNKNYISPFQYHELYGHFSQVVWAETWKVGCGYVAYKEGNIKRLYVCNYGPRGNYRGATMYKQGTPSSDCPSNSCGSCKIKGPTYNGLCKVRNLSLGPVYNKIKDPILDCNWRKLYFYCPAREIGSGTWLEHTSNSGSYFTVRLKPGEKSALQLIDTIQPKSSKFCVQVVFRKGPVNADEKDLGKLFLASKIQGETRYQHLLIPTKSKKTFSTFNMNFPWNKETLIMLDLYVPPDASEHIFDIKEILAFEGSCSNRKN